MLLFLSLWILESIPLWPCRGDFAGRVVCLTGMPFKSQGSVSGIQYATCGSFIHWIPEGCSVSCTSFKAIVPGPDNAIQTIENQITTEIEFNNSFDISGFIYHSTATDTSKVYISGRPLPQQSTVKEPDPSFRDYTPDVAHLVSSPVVNGACFFFPGDQVLSYHEPTNLWLPVIAPDTLLHTGVGYAIQGSPVSYSGVFNTGDLSLPNVVTYSGNLHGFNLVGNPYPSGLDVSAVSTWGSEISNDVYVWDQAYGNYRTSVTTIPPAQGFFIRTTGNGPTLTIPNSARMHTSDPLYKSEVLNQLTLSLSGNGYGDEAFIRFAEGSSATFDHSFDTPKKMGLAEAPQLFSVVVSDNFTDLTRNVLPRIEGNETVHLSFLAGNTGSFILEASGIESFSDDVVITLVDQLTNTTQVLSQNPVYSFNGSPVDDPARFLVLFDDHTASQSVSATHDIVVFTVGHTVKLLVPEYYTGTVTMTDMLGRVVWRQPLAGQSHYSFIAPVPAGCYVVSTESRHGSLRKKIILH